MAPKSKKAAPAKEEVKETKEAEEPAAKKAKAEEKPVEKKDEGIEETEVDDKKAAGAKISDKVVFDASETTLNVVPMMGGSLLTALSEGGMQHLLAGARGNVGVKSGRYMYEAKLLETLSHSTGGGRPGAGAKHVLRLGFSTAGSSLLLGDNAEGIYFDSEGMFGSADDKGTMKRKRWAEKQKGQQRIAKDVVIGVLLNLDGKSPNANTISLFRNGERVSDPQPLPEALHGKVLFPHISYRNVTVHVNFGAQLWKALPFKTTSLGAAAQADVKVEKPKAKGAKPEVVFPVGFPEKGTFDWVDAFHQKNPGYVEISDRKLVEWAQASGVQMNKGGGKNNSRDRPSLNTGVHAIDDFSARKVMYNVASVVPRNYIVVEVKRNLTTGDRKELLKKFPSFAFKRSAKVIMGEPNAEFKGMVKDKILKVKQDKSDALWKRKKADKERQKAAEQRRKEAAAKKAAAAEKKDGEEKKEEENKNEEKKEEEEETEPPKVELTEEEEKMTFVKQDVPDITSLVLDASYASFSIPEKAEGFDDVKFEWEKEGQCKDSLRAWILEKKKTSKIDNLVAGEWFKTQTTEWNKKKAAWMAKQKEAAKTKKMNEDEEKAIDPLECENVDDAKDGAPLYLNFTAEDWVLLSLRWELYTLATAYKKDVNDEDRTNVPEQYFSFYYQKYYKRSFNTKTFGKENLTDLLKLVKDMAALEDGHLTTSLDAELPSTDIFVKLTEVNRRERQRRIAAGDETARLNITTGEKK
eukprot:TRINITY_DN213_c1_g1_i2.p1 TRINITY_DN213_c1_g1~~TRINITY_DN213_c1_g1_i2.p1  ORF type:complete len:750 (-),score=337.98 TRINITY_DN213_c1_g1_i2:95-2344(-)